MSSEIIYLGSLATAILQIKPYTIFYNKSLKTQERQCHNCNYLGQEPDGRNICGKCLRNQYFVWAENSMSIFGKGMEGRRYHQLHNGIKSCWMCDGLLLITWVIDYWYMDVFIDEQFFRESREKVWMFSILVSWLWIPIVIPEYIKFYQLRFKFEFLGRSALWLVEERRGGGGWEREVRWLAQSPVSSQGARTERRTALQYRHLITSQRETTDK